jgi:FkbM family methyltransferase
MNKIDFIQIGAFTGNTEQKEDIIWPLVNNDGWRGILVEPLPQAFPILLENYKNIPGLFFENLAITDYNGTIDIHFWAGGDLRIASTFVAHCKDKNTAIINVPCITLTSLIQKYNLFNTKFKLLQIDTEGLDGRILLTTDFTNIKVQHIRFEHCHLHMDDTNKVMVIEHLSQFGYVEIKDIYDNHLTGEEGIDTLMENIEYA